MIFNDVIRLRVFRSTSKRKLWNRNICPDSGIARASLMTRPAIVVASSSGDQAMARLRSRIGTEPSTITEPSDIKRTP
jgi:hypothetical protein